MPRSQLFVAYEADSPVGRISAQIDRCVSNALPTRRASSAFSTPSTIRRFCCALLKAAEDWLANRGMKRVQGPFSFSINDEMGLLVAGFDRPPAIMMGHARPYYRTHIEALGYAKARM